MGINANNRVPCDEETAREAFSTGKSMLEEMLERDPSCQVSSFIVGLRNLYLMVCFSNFLIRTQWFC